MLLIQYIKVEWDKACRGGSGAVQRSKMQQAAGLSDDFFDYTSFGFPAHYTFVRQDRLGFHTQINRREIINEADSLRFLSGEPDYVYKQIAELR